MNLLALALLAVVSSPPAEVRPDVRDTVQKAAALASDLDEDKALALLATLVARKDLNGAELSLVELHRGLAFMGLNKLDEADGAFSTARGCNGLVQLPAGVSPKVRQVFNSAVPLDCPVVVRPPPDPTENLPTPVLEKPLAPPPAPISVPVEEKGLPVLGIVGSGIAAGGGLLLALALGVAFLSTVAVVGSYGVQAGARAADHARDARNQSLMAFVLRVSGGVVLAVAGAGMTVALVTLAAGAAAAAWGFLR
jgi:hypothetical protein